MSRTEININQAEMERCMAQLLAFRIVWGTPLSLNSCIIARSKGKSAEMLECCFKTSNQVTAAMNELLDKTVQSFGTAKEKYEEVDICMAKSMDGK